MKMHSSQSNEQTGKQIPSMSIVLTFAPCRELANSAELNPLLPEYTLVAPMMGDYYQITTNWATFRTEMWNALQRIGAGDGTVESILAELQTVEANSNVG